MVSHNPVTTIDKPKYMKVMADLFSHALTRKTSVEAETRLASGEATKSFTTEPFWITAHCSGEPSLLRTMPLIVSTTTSVQ
jgi:hypothetical protein